MPKLSVQEEAEVLAEIITSRRAGAMAYALRELDAMPKKKGYAVVARLLNYLSADKHNGDYYVTQFRLALTNRV